MANRLSKIVTRTGDGGTTGLGDGSRVSKESARIAAIGDVDELNSAVGVLRAETLPPDVDALLAAVQHDLSRDIILGIEYAEPLGRADNLLMGLASKIKDAPQGYAGFFDAVKVKEEDLARLYEFDELMLGHAEQAAADVAALHKAVHSSGDLNDAISTLSHNLRAANEAFNSRQEVLNQVSVANVVTKEDIQE